MISLQKLNTYSPRKIGFAQAVGVIVYIFLFALAATQIEKLQKPPEIIAATIFLTAFVISALTCGMLVLGYPAFLALRGQIKRAAEVVFWSGGWLALILAIITLIVIAFYE